MNGRRPAQGSYDETAAWPRPLVGPNRTLTARSTPLVRFRSPPLHALGTVLAYRMTRPWVFVFEKRCYVDAAVGEAFFDCPLLLVPRRRRIAERWRSRARRRGDRAGHGEGSH